MEQNGLSVKNAKGGGSIRLVDRSNNPGIVDVPINEASAGKSIPKGTIIMFKGNANNIPTEWRFCDGTNNTPNLRNRFVVGVGSHFGVDTIGGEKSNLMPAHTHGSFSTNTQGVHSHSFDFSKTYTNTTGNHHHSTVKSRNGNIQTKDYHGTHQYNYGSDDHTMAYAGEHTHTLDLPNITSSKSSSHSHRATISTHNSTGVTGEENLPPYYTLAFIQKVV